MGDPVIRTIHQDSSGRDINRFDDLTLHVITSAARSKVLFYPYPGSVVQVVGYYAVVETTIAGANENGIIGIEAIENAVAIATMDSFGPMVGADLTLTAGTRYDVTPAGIWVNGTLTKVVSTDKFAPFYLSAAKGDYAALSVLTAMTGGGAAGKVYMGLYWEWLAKPSFGDDASNYFG